MCLMKKKFEENKELVAVEQILRVVYLDPQRPTPVSVDLDAAFE